VEDDMTDDVDRAIAQYRSELTAEAELAKTDLLEIEDHFRALYDELRATGVPVSAAITEAAHRLGEPRTVALEHARVRAPFGATLSRLRAYSAAVLLVPLLLFGIQGWLTTFALGILTAVLAGLVAQRTWARAIALGILVDLVVRMPLVMSHQSGIGTWQQVVFACLLGALAFVAPWRRRELTAAGYALALLGPAYGGAIQMFHIWITAPDHSRVYPLWGALATFAVLAAGLGTLMRARWAAPVALAAAFALIRSAHQIMGLTARMPNPGWFRASFLSMLVVGAAASLAAAVLAWRARRSTFGTLRGILR
jgi:hypothetical protein